MVCGTALATRGGCYFWAMDKAHWTAIVADNTGSAIRHAIAGDPSPNSRSWRLTLDDDREVFLKTLPGEEAARMFRMEAQGLEALRSTGTLSVPGVLGYGLHAGTGFLLLEWIPSSRPGPGWARALGEGLASLHRQSADAFGWQEDTFIASIPLSGRQHPGWTGFYGQERLAPLYASVRDKGYFHRSDDLRMARIYRMVAEQCPEEPPALVHGDLWSGNVLTGQDGKPVLIDPSVHYGHRESDLAMMHLFGGFPSACFQVYEEAWPLTPGFHRRMGLYQLFPLLVHTLLFGGRYARSVRAVWDDLGA